MNSTATPVARPHLAAFPKAWMDDLCVNNTMTLRQWIELGSTLGVEGLEFYPGFTDLKNPAGWPAVKRLLDDHNLKMPMLCCSPDFTHPDKAFRQKEIDAEKRNIDMAAALGASYCRVLSGQRRPEVSRVDGIAFAAECIEACIPHAADRKIQLNLENHYKDSYWIHPEFAQKMDVFCDLVDRIHSPHFGVNYDPSNTILAGEDPLELLSRIKHRVITMHASDRYLAEGTIEDLRREEDSVGYAKRLRHGEIGKGMNDYDEIFRQLKGVGFASWISIEDGVDGVDQLRRSVTYLKDKIAQHWGT